MIKAVIIDDDMNMHALFRSYLQENFPNVEICAYADSVSSGVEMIQKHEPDLVLLDIEIKEGTGFHILQKLKPYSFKVVFITAFNHYAIKAIKFSAIDYVMKPVNEVEFIQAINSAIELIHSKVNDRGQQSYFLDSYKKETQTKKLVLRTIDFMDIVDVADIVWCKSDNSYTTFYFTEDDPITVSRGIHEYDDLLKEFGFFRPHRSYLVNLNHVKKVDKNDGGFIVMKNQKEIPVSVRLKKALLRLLQEL